MKKSKLILCILDGFGYSSSIEGNAIAQAHMPFLGETYRKCAALLEASGPAVGLPEGQMGNSEVGHMTIGAGRIIQQDLLRINDALQSGALANNKTFKELVRKTQSGSGSCHVICMISEGGVHSHFSHLKAICTLLQQHNINIYLHAITDGRDTPPKSCASYIKYLLDQGLDIHTISGRYWAMDRDNRWDRVNLYYDAITSAHAPKFSNPLDLIDINYKHGTTDEFIKPHVLESYKGVQQADSLIMLNFRPDRASQILTSLLDPAFNGFARKKLVYKKFTKAVGMRDYSLALRKFMDPIFTERKIENTIGQWLEKLGLSQLRIAETEKFPHVTYFLNGGRETQYKGEKRILIPSPLVATYDQKPEMSAIQITDKLIAELTSDWNFVCVNFANLDMVGHTGNLPATISACRAIDLCLAKITKAAKQYNYDLIVTSDHGNAEQNIDSKTKQPHTAHTLNPVPIIYFGTRQNIRFNSGGLADVIPTVLHLMGLPKPQDMTGKSLVMTPIQPGITMIQ